MQDLKDSLSKKLYGMTLTEALEKNICVDCKKGITEKSFYSEAGKKEYFTSGLCEFCFDKIFKDED